jgi:hypothetical protein
MACGTDWCSLMRRLRAISSACWSIQQGTDGGSASTRRCGSGGRQDSGSR